MKNLFYKIWSVVNLSPSVDATGQIIENCPASYDAEGNVVFKCGETSYLGEDHVYVMKKTSLLQSRYTLLAKMIVGTTDAAAVLVIEYYELSSDNGVTVGNQLQNATFNNTY